MRIALNSGAYSARSLIADAQRCVNLYPEPNPQDAEAPATHYQTPGLTLVSTPPVAGPCRATYAVSANKRFDVVGSNVYSVDAAGNYTLLGTLFSTVGPVSIADNGVSAFVVDGTLSGYIIDLASNKMTVCTDPAFYGASKVDFVDGYFIFNKPNTQQFFISNYQSVTFNSLDIASKSTAPDNLITLAVMHREIWLFGEKTTEVWYNTGAADFTFGRMPGVFIEHGCAAPASVAKVDLALFWLSKDAQGQGLVFAGKNYQASRISTYALEAEFATYPRIDDAIGFAYLQNGHAFYCLNFPTANKTWCFDVAVGQWHQRAYLEVDGSLSRHRMNCCTFNGGQNLVGDWQNGKVYALDANAYTDNGNPIIRIRSFPHINGSDGNRIMFRQFIADMEVGNGAPGDTAQLEIRLRWSNDRGASWGNAITGTLGKVGQFLTSIQFQRLGYARDRVFELSWGGNVKTALNGAWVDVQRSRT